MLFEKYQAIIEDSDKASYLRSFYGQYSEHPQIYGHYFLKNFLYGWTAGL